MKWIKPWARGVGTVMALPYLTAYGLLGVVLGKDHAWTTATEAIARVPGIFGVYTRQAFYKRLLDRVGSDVYFGFMSILSKRQAVIGDRVYIGRFCVVGRVHLGDEVMLADGVQVLSGRHQHGGAIDKSGSWHRNGQRFEQVRVGNGAWLGAGAVVMADVGAAAVVGAGAVVVHPVEPASRVGGVPAVALTRKAA